MNLFQDILDSVTDLQLCRGKKWVDYKQKHVSRIRKLLRALPQGDLSGSGRDVGTSIDFYQSNEDQLVFRTNYRHPGGWSAHEITARPTGASFRVEVRSDYSDAPGVNIDDRVAQEFRDALATVPRATFRTDQSQTSKPSLLGVSA